MTPHDANHAPHARTEADLPERPIFLVLLASAPTVFMVHFLASYVTASVWCARASGQGGTLGPVTTTVAIYTAVALGAIGFSAWHGARRHRHGGEDDAPHDMDTPGDRHRFLGFATVLLAGLSAVATVYVGLTLMFFASC